LHRTFGSRGCPTLHLADRYAERKTPTLCFAFSARMRQAGIPLEDIKDFLGHKDVSTTQVYWNGNSFFDKFYKVQNFFPYAIPIVLDNEPPRM